MPMHPLGHRKTVQKRETLRRRSTTATTKSTTEGRGKLARGALLALLLTASVTTLTTRTTTATRATVRTVVTAHHATRGSVRALLLDVGSGHNLRREVKPFTQVLKTLGGEGVVVVLPREASLDVAAGLERLAGLDHLLTKH